MQFWFRLSCSEVLFKRFGCCTLGNERDEAEVGIGSCNGPEYSLVLVLRLRRVLVVISDILATVVWTRGGLRYGEGEIVRM
jgi:hypothetical protein